jgi:hypothetical protein
MSKPTRTAIVVAILIIVGLGILVLIGVSSLFVMRNVAIEPGTTESARSAFDRARAPFAGRTPMIEIAADGSIRNHADRAASPKSPITTLHVLVWDSDRERLVKADIPFWAVRLKNSMPGMRTEVPLWVLALQGDGHESGMKADGPMLRFEDIERFGPGLIIDAELSRGRRVLMWAQ